ncbi:MAG: helix-turn-helix domain-containing protein [Pseudohongiellaceae bacterium]
MGIQLVRDKKTLGQRMKRLRQSKGWTAAKLAAIIGLSRNALVYWESGVTMPLDGVLTFCHELNIPPSVLFEYDDSEFDGYCDLIDVRAQSLEL